MSCRTRESDCITRSDWVSRWHFTVHVDRITSNYNYFTSNTKGRTHLWRERENVVQMSRNKKKKLIKHFSPRRIEQAHSDGWCIPRALWNCIIISDSRRARQAKWKGNFQQWDNCAAEEISCEALAAGRFFSMRLEELYYEWHLWRLRHLASYYFHRVIVWLLLRTVTFIHMVNPLIAIARLNYTFGFDFEPKKLLAPQTKTVFLLLATISFRTGKGKVESGDGNSPKREKS